MNHQIWVLKYIYIYYYIYIYQPGWWTNAYNPIPNIENTSQEVNSKKIQYQSRSFQGSDSISREARVCLEPQ